MPYISMKNILILIILICSQCLNLKLKNHKSKGLFDWDPKWRFEASDDYSIKIYKNKKECNESCKICYKTTQWDDTKKNISSNENSFICLEEVKAIPENKKSKHGTTTWYKRDVCNAFCQATKLSRCYYAQECYQKIGKVPCVLEWIYIC
jgi:hypothetical protein